MKKNSVNVGISVPTEMWDWLEKNKDIPRSKLFQDAVNDIRYPQNHKVTPMTYFFIALGTTFGVACLVASTSNFIGVMMSTTFCLLGVVLILVSLITLIKERK